MEKGYIIIITTTKTKKDMEKISNVLLKEKLSPCIQIFGPIISNYWWKGKLETTKEWFCFIKSKKEFYKKIEKVIKRHHPYKIPEIIAIPICNGNKGYLNWLKNELNY